MYIRIPRLALAASSAVSNAAAPGEPTLEPSSTSSLRSLAPTTSVNLKATSATSVSSALLSRSVSSHADTTSSSLSTTTTATLVDSEVSLPTTTVDGASTRSTATKHNVLTPTTRSEVTSTISATVLSNSPFSSASSPPTDRTSNGGASSSSSHSFSHTTFSPSSITSTAEPKSTVANSSTIVGFSVNFTASSTASDTSASTRKGENEATRGNTSAETRIDSSAITSTSPGPSSSASTHTSLDIDISSGANALTKPVTSKDRTKTTVIGLETSSISSTTDVGRSRSTSLKPSRSATRNASTGISPSTSTDVSPNISSSASVIARPSTRKITSITTSTSTRKDTHTSLNTGGRTSLTSSQSRSTSTSTSTKASVDISTSATIHHIASASTRTSLSKSTSIKTSLNPVSSTSLDADRNKSKNKNSNASTSTTTSVVITTSRSTSTDKNIDTRTSHTSTDTISSTHTKSRTSASVNRVTSASTKTNIVESSSTSLVTNGKTGSTDISRSSFKQPTISASNISHPNHSKPTAITSIMSISATEVSLTTVRSSKDKSPTPIGTHASTDRTSSLAPTSSSSTKDSDTSTSNVFTSATHVKTTPAFSDSTSTHIASPDSSRSNSFSSTISHVSTPGPSILFSSSSNPVFVPPTLTLTSISSKATHTDTQLQTRQSTALVQQSSVILPSTISSRATVSISDAAPASVRPSGAVPTTAVVNTMTDTDAVTNNTALDPPTHEVVHAVAPTPTRAEPDDKQAEGTGLSTFVTTETSTTTITTTSTGSSTTMTWTTTSLEIQTETIVSTPNVSDNNESLSADRRLSPGAIAGISAGTIVSLALLALLVFFLLRRKRQRGQDSVEKGIRQAETGRGLGHVARPSQVSFFGEEGHEESKDNDGVGEKREGIFERIRPLFTPRGDAGMASSEPQSYGLLSTVGDAENEWDEKNAIETIEQKGMGGTHAGTDGIMGNAMPSNSGILLEANPFDDPTVPTSTPVSAATVPDSVKAIGTTSSLTTTAPLHPEDPFWDPQDLLPPVLRMIANHTRAKKTGSAVAATETDDPAVDVHLSASGKLNVHEAKTMNLISPAKQETTQVNVVKDPFADNAFTSLENHTYETSPAGQREGYTSWVTQTDWSLRSSPFGANFDTRLDMISGLGVKVDPASPSIYSGVRSSVSSRTGAFSQFSATNNVDGKSRTRPVSAIRHLKGVTRRSDLLSVADSELTLEARTDSDSGHGDGYAGYDRFEGLDDEEGLDNMRHESKNIGTAI